MDGNLQTDSSQPALKALAESRAQLAAIVASAMDAIITIDEDQRITLFNNAAEQMFGYIADMVLGRPIDILIPERYREAHREHVKRFGYTGVTSREMGALAPLYGLRANGQEFSIEASISQVEVEGVLLFTVIMREITERQAVAKALADSQTQLSGIVGSAMDAIITVDEEQRIRLFNAAAERIFGYRAGVVLGQPLDMLLPKDYRELHHEHIQRFSRTGVTTRTMRGLGTLFARRANGEEFPIEASISQIEVGGKKLFTVILRDVTEKHRSDQQLNQTLSMLKATLESVAGAVAVFDSAGRLILHNRTFEELWDLPGELLLGAAENLWSHIAAQVDTPGNLRETMAEVFLNLDAEARQTLRLKDGRTVEHFSIPHRLDGSAVGRVSTFHTSSRTD